jgi:hypothetical protein
VAVLHELGASLVITSYQANKLLFARVAGSGLSTEGQPKYVTALGEPDAPQGWCANKAQGGCLIEVESSTGLPSSAARNAHRFRALGKNPSHRLVWAAGLLQNRLARYECDRRAEAVVAA